jgi:hypothetical protein
VAQLQEGVQSVDRRKDVGNVEVDPRQVGSIGERHGRVHKFNLGKHQLEEAVRVLVRAPRGGQLQAGERSD